MRAYPYSFHVALDGNGLNGLEGRAGVCLFRYDPADEAHAYKVSYFWGAPAGTPECRPEPARSAGFLGNTGQHLLFYDPATLDEADRVSTLRFEVPDRLDQGAAPTWSGWTTCSSSPRSASTCGRFDVNMLAKAERIAPHQRQAAPRDEAHGLGTATSSTAAWTTRRGARPARSASSTCTPARPAVSPLPTTCWHVAVPPDARTCSTRSRFRVAPQDGQRLPRVGDGLLQGVCLRDRRRAAAQVLRHWVGRPGRAGAHQLRRHRSPTPS